MSLADFLAMALVLWGFFALVAGLPIVGGGLIVTAGIIAVVSHR